MEDMPIDSLLAKLVAANQMVSISHGDLIKKSWQDERDQIASVITRRFPDIDQEQVMLATVGSDL